MSHVTKQCSKIAASELGALERACQSLNVQLQRGETTFKWYSGVGECDHRIENPNAPRGAFHVGLKEEEDGSLTALFDTWGGQGGWIPAMLGDKLNSLREQYTAEVARESLEAQGYMVHDFERDPETDELLVEAELA